MSAERITRKDWKRALNVLIRGMDAIEAELQPFDGCPLWEIEPEHQGRLRRCRKDLESAHKVFRRLFDEKVRDD